MKIHFWPCLEVLCCALPADVAIMTEIKSWPLPTDNLTHLSFIALQHNIDHEERHGRATA